MQKLENEPLCAKTYKISFISTHVRLPSVGKYIFLQKIYFLLTITGNLGYYQWVDVG